MHTTCWCRRRQSQLVSPNTGRPRFGERSLAPDAGANEMLAYLLNSIPIGTEQNASMNGKDFEHEYRLVTPDNSVKYVHVVAHGFSGKSGRVEFVGAVMDVTERKRAEEALREAQANLARVSRVTTIGELTVSLAHEVNQPIAAAVTDANTCLRWLTRDQPDLEEARAAASRI